MTKLNKALSLIILLSIAVSCGKNNDSNFTLKGKVKGLKKGVVYLQKDGDSSIVNLDSMAITGQSEFSLHTNLEEPILLYLKLFKNDGEEHYIPFFADKGITEINTTLKNFNFDSEIKGSKQQALLDEYLEIMSQYNNKSLDVIEERYLAQRDNDSIAVDSLGKISDQLIKRKYAYTIQFAINNKNSEVAPYLAMYEARYANTVYIDSIYNSLTAEIKESFYGKQLGEVVANRNKN
ncbi:uncharacterized protein DUF4369 [Winogradskyella eximia]|jgi:Domain of unknown function (DUF4369)|uniref:Uncharacterized protein DUF4369 n=1 Tax=Winogradskyella eximia TaxID=262006 RepID=A0A3D9GZZ3_9FLAO|nr:DUF4369 domain-containing protein [Winogradskyella eximia]RED42810.1 uncharacterized protein DUF4369 [Winogradskyella eximia]|tara:strand:- start:7545 stop:8252 length:708 start_codon:yes stop_codon:yes gene_type:complete